MTSRQHVSTDVSCLSRTMTVSRVKVTAQLASHSGPTPIKVCQKTGIGCPFIGNPNGIGGKARYPAPVDFWVCPVAVPTVTFGAALSMLTTGSSVAK